MPLQCEHIEFKKEYFRHFYLCNYRPRHKGTDALSESLIRFKMKNPIDVEAWTYCAIVELKKVLKSKPLMISRALSRDELATNLENHSALDWMGKQLQNHFEGRYSPEVLSKVHTTRSIKLLTRTEREEELREVYHFEEPPDDYSEVLIIDDILTTGTTLREIIRAIRSVITDSSIVLFTLARTDHAAPLNKDISLSGYDYSWKDQQWQMVSEEREQYLSLEQLKSCILNDDFSY